MRIQRSIQISAIVSLTSLFLVLGSIFYFHKIDSEDISSTRGLDTAVKIIVLMHGEVADMSGPYADRAEEQWRAQYSQLTPILRGVKPFDQLSASLQVRILENHVAMGDLFNKLSSKNSSQKSLELVRDQLEVNATSMVSYILSIDQIMNAHVNQQRFWTLSIIAISIIILSAVIVRLLYFFSQRIARPIVGLMDATTRFCAGNFDQKIPIEGNDEITELGSSFEKMRVALAQRLEELIAANKNLAFENIEKSKRVAELVIANEEKAKRALELQASMKETQQTKDEMLSSLNALSLARDNETGNHVIRTQFYVKAIATRLFKMGKYPEEINERTIELMFKAAPLHDIGKVGIPDAVLQKPGKLNDEEWIIMKTHTTIGERILSAAHTGSENRNTVIDMAIQIAGGHHERWDGGGYPRGLKGDAIPLSARIMAIADVYDALVSKRVYKQAWSQEQALEEIIPKSGTQFDPVIIEAFVLEESHLNEIAKLHRDS